MVEPVQFQFRTCQTAKRKIFLTEKKLKVNNVSWMADQQRFTGWFNWKNWKVITIWMLNNLKSWILLFAWCSKNCNLEIRSIYKGFKVWHLLVPKRKSQVIFWMISFCAMTSKLQLFQLILLLRSLNIRLEKVFNLQTRSCHQNSFFFLFTEKGTTWGDSFWNFNS